MQVKQVYNFVNSISKQAYGEQAVTATDMTGLIAMGNTILSTPEATDAFLRTLIDRIGRVVIGTRAYSADTTGILMNTFDYGCIMQKITVQPMAAVEAPQWSLTGGEAVDQYIITKPDVRQKLFDGLTAWEIDVTIPDMQIKSAFTTPEALTAFIDGIFTAMENSMQIQLERTGEMAVANFIGEKIWAQANNTGGIHCIHLLQSYNTKTGLTLTADKALRDLEFLKFATTQINLYVNRMTKMSVLFNTEKYKRFTPRDLLRVTMLSDFVTAENAYLQSDTFHRDLVALPNYRETLYWQGSGQEYGYAETSKIAITTSDGHSVTQDGVICLLNDVEAIGMTIDNRRLRTSPPNGRGEYTNYFSKADIRYYNDMSENGLVFTVTDNPVTAGA